MQVPLQVTFKGIDRSEAVDTRIREEVDRLEGFYDRITSAHVTVAKPEAGHHRQAAYSIQIKLEIPGTADIVVSREPGAREVHNDVNITIRDAFAAARRQLQDVARERRGDVKHHDAPPQGTIAELQPERDHGFIASSDGRRIYFHRNTVADDAFDSLAVGMAVRFSEARGDEGPQATFVKTLH